MVGSIPCLEGLFLSILGKRRAYQVQGGSESGQYMGWKLFYMHEIRQPTILPRKFCGLRPDYKQNDKTFLRIDAQI